MKRDWINGILGVLVIILAFLGFPSSVKAVLMIIIGLAIAFLSFWKGVSEKARREVSDIIKKQKTETEDQNNYLSDGDKEISTH
ncbi:MAG TPA: hypothetical protein ENG99_00165 [bacterium]|nr:hypothetical protein [bacterium]